jgi:hypothetical protein
MNDFDDDIDLIDEQQAARLLDELADALSSEISSTDVDRAVDAYWMARTDALVAELEQELDDTEMAGVRGSGRSRRLSFSGPMVAISLDVDPVDRRVAGEVSPPTSTVRWLGRDGSSRALPLDERGRFDVVADHGPACVEVCLANGQVVRSAWTLI